MAIKKKNMRMRCTVAALEDGLASFTTLHN